MLLLGLLAACGSGGAVSDPGDRTSAGSPGASPSSPQRLALREDLVDPRVVDFTVRSHRGRTVELALSAGPAECEAAHATVRESSSRVAIRLQVGGYPGAAQDCAALAEASVVTVELSAPLGDRPVVPLD